MIRVVSDNSIRIHPAGRNFFLAVFIKLNVSVFSFNPITLLVKLITVTMRIIVFATVNFFYKVTL